MNFPDRAEISMVAGPGLECSSKMTREDVMTTWSGGLTSSIEEAVDGIVSDVRQKTDKSSIALTIIFNQKT